MCLRCISSLVPGYIARANSGKVVHSLHTQDTHPLSLRHVTGHGYATTVSDQQTCVLGSQWATVISIEVQLERGSELMSFFDSSGRHTA